MKGDGFKLIKIVEGDILNAKEDIIGHQVNCVGVMGAGLAKQIRNKYPKAYDEYLRLVKRHDDKNELLGIVQEVEAQGRRIVNLFCQLNVGTHKQQTSYIAIDKALRRVAKRTKELSLSVALPYGIGCGLAGGDWNTVYEIIEDAFSDYEVTLYRLK